MKSQIKNFIVVIVCFLIFSCAAQEKTVKSLLCEGSIIVQYDKVKSKDKKSKALADESLKAFTVFFLNDFNDSIQGYVNGKLKFNEFVKTDKSKADSEKYFGYSYSKDNIDSIPILKIVLKRANTCFDIPIDKKYKLIYIFITSENKWIVRFSNLQYQQ